MMQFLKYSVYLDTIFFSYYLECNKRKNVLYSKKSIFVAGVNCMKIDRFAQPRIDVLK